MWRARRTVVPAVAPWLFRLTVFVAFMCGGALAQHYFAATPPSRAEPTQEHKGNVAVAVLPQATRLPEFQAPSPDSAPLEPPAPFLAPQPSSPAFVHSSLTVEIVARAPRPFDALAPPVNA